MFEKFKFQKIVTVFSGVFKVIKTKLEYLCSLISDCIIISSKFHLKLALIKFSFFPNFRNLGVKFRILNGRQTKKIFLQVF